MAEELFYVSVEEDVGHEWEDISHVDGYETWAYRKKWKKPYHCLNILITLESIELSLKQLDSYIEQENIEGIICFLTYLDSKISLVNSEEKESLKLNIKYFNDLMDLKNHEIDQTLYKYPNLFHWLSEDDINNLHKRMLWYVIW